MSGSRGTEDAAADERVARERWSQAHGDVDPYASVWISGWLSIAHRLTRHLAGRHIPPGRVTAVGLVVAALVPLFAGLGGGWPLVAAAWLVLAGVLDGVDGALARWDGSGSRWGSVLDEVADRCSDLLLLLALVLLGAPPALGVAAGVLTLLMDAARSSARAAGLAGVGALTVWERPSRVIVGAFGTGLCGIAGLVLRPASVDTAAAWIATGAAAIAVLLAATGLLHLLVVLRRLLGGAAVTPDRRAR